VADLSKILDTWPSLASCMLYII